MFLTVREPFVKGTLPIPIPEKNEVLIKILIYFVATSVASIINEVFGIIVGIAGLLFLINESYKK